MYLIGRELNDDDRYFLAEVTVIVVALLLGGFSGPYTTLVVLGLGTVYTFFVLWLLGQGGMETFDEFTEGLVLARLPAIVLAAPGITFWYIA